MNREQMTKELVELGISQVVQMETHQWLGVIRSLFNLSFSLMGEEEIKAYYKEMKDEKDDRQKRS